MELQDICIDVIITNKLNKKLRMKRISTENLNLLPNPRELKNICKSIAALEAIICPEWEYRYYSYQKDWSETEELFEMRTGQGDKLLVIFSTEGTCLNGFAHASKFNRCKNVLGEENNSLFQNLFGQKKEPQTKLKQETVVGILDRLPKEFQEFIYGEPVKSIGTTFCIWQTKTDNNWKIGEVELPNDEYKDGSSDLLQLLDGNPLTYKNWLEEYYEKSFEENKLELELVEKIYNRTIITKEIIVEINPNLSDFQLVKSNLDKIGYENML